MTDDNKNDLIQGEEFDVGNLSLGDILVEVQRLIVIYGYDAIVRPDSSNHGDMTVFYSRDAEQKIPAEIKTSYVEGDMTREQLAAKYGMPPVGRAL
jgi:hypothetical protein